MRSDYYWKSAPNSTRKQQKHFLRGQLVRRKNMRIFIRKSKKGCTEIADLLLVNSMTCNQNQTRRRAGILNVHPAPYRDHIFQRINKRSIVDCEVLQYFDIDHGHTEWEWNRPPYVSKSLSSS